MKDQGPRPDCQVNQAAGLAVHGDQMTRPYDKAAKEVRQQIKKREQRTVATKKCRRCVWAVKVDTDLMLCPFGHCLHEKKTGDADACEK